MKELNNLINSIFCFSSDDKDDNIQILFSKYQTENEEEKKNLLQALVNILGDIKIFNLNKWCLILSKLISYSFKENKSIENIIEILIPSSDKKNSPTEAMGRKLALLILLNHLIPIMNDIKISSDILLKVLFYISQFISDKVIGIMASFILSRFINHVSLRDFNQTMVPILKLIFSKDSNNFNHLYLILLSLKEEHVSLLENIKFPNFKSSNELNKFIETFKKLNNNIISVYFNSFATSTLFENFWNLFTDCLDKEKMNYQECGVFLTCLIESICPSELGALNLQNSDQKLHVFNIVWRNSYIWKSFFSHLSDEKSLFQGLCKNAIIQLKSKQSHLDIISNLFFELFLDIVDVDCHLLESKISPIYRLSQCLIPSVKNINHMIKYVDLLTNFSKLEVVADKEKVFLIEQIAFVCCNSNDFSLQNVCIERIITIVINELVKVDSLSEFLKRSSYLSLISCIHHSLTIQDMTMSKHLLYLKSVMTMVIANLNIDPNKFKRLLIIFKSLGKYIDEQLEFQYSNEVIITKVFPCFGSIICYLSLFLLTKIFLNDFEQSMGLCDQIIDWIKKCFQAAYKSIELNKEVDIPNRKRMLSISSISSDIEEYNIEESENQHSHWSFYLFDILLKVYDEDANLMNETVNNIISLMIQKKVIDISGIRYVKNLILLEKARNRKISELDSFVPSKHIDINDPIKLKLKSIHFQERCLNILSVIILEGHDVEIIASCLFIMLEICSGGDKILINKIEKTVKGFKEKSKLVKLAYLNGENVTRAINSILILSNNASKYDNFAEMTSDMIIGLINRIKLDEETLNFFKCLLQDNFFGGITNFQKLILQCVFMENIELSWQMRKYLLNCLENPKTNRINKYKALSIICNIVKRYRSCKDKLIFQNYEDFAKESIQIIINILSSLNFEALNVKYVSIILECLISFIVSDFGRFELQSEILENLKHVIKDKKNNELIGITNKFLGIYDCKDFNLKMVSIEKLYEYDQHISYLLKLLPIEFNKEISETSSSKSIKATKEIKVLSKFNLISEKKSVKENDNNLNAKSSLKNSNIQKKNEKRKCDLSNLETPRKKKMKIEQNCEKTAKVEMMTVGHSGKKKKSKIENVDEESQLNNIEQNKNDSVFEISVEKKKKNKKSKDEKKESQSPIVEQKNPEVEMSVKMKKKKLKNKKRNEEKEVPQLTIVEQNKTSPEKKKKVKKNKNCENIHQSNLEKSQDVKSLNNANEKSLNDNLSKKTKKSKKKDKSKI